MQPSKSGIESLLQRLERLSATIKERELELVRLERERQEVRTIIRAAAGSQNSDDDTLDFGARKKEPTPSERQTVEAIRAVELVVDRTWVAKRFNISLDAAAIRLARCYAKGLLR